VGRTNAIDLTNCSFNEFVSFVFDRDVSLESQGKDYWYWHIEVVFDATVLCGYYVELFRKPEFLLSRFTKSQIEEGLWAIQVPNLDCSVYRVIENSDVPLNERQTCIQSMADLFRNLFRKEAFDSSVQMWFDSLCFDWASGYRKREHGGENLELQDTYFETLRDILFIESWACQGAALHGLGHLHHPATKELIERFLKTHPNLKEEQKSYALAAARFEVQ
jgi:hypothetical protein